MHGEYKAPGGKLIVADLDIRDGKLTNVGVSGDFFLDPPEALDGIIGALEDAPADLPRRRSPPASATLWAPTSRCSASPPRRWLAP